LKSNTKGYGDKTHYTDSQNSGTIAPIGRELYHLQFSLQAASPETFGYTLVYWLWNSGYICLVAEASFMRITHKAEDDSKTEESSFASLDVFERSICFQLNLF
jgi:hypothetical protein